MSNEPVFDISEADLSRLITLVNKKLVPIPVKAVVAMNSVAEVWMTEAKRDTPFRYGALRGSGRVVPPVKVEGNVESRLVFGSIAAPYAKIVHENMKAHHDTGHAKWLERVVVAHRNSFGAEVVVLMGRM